MPRSSNALLVARIGKPHGLRGEVTVQTHTDDPEARYVPGTVFDTEAQPGTGVPRTLTVSTARLHRQIWLLGFAEIPDRTGAESLRGTQLFLDPDEADEVESDEDDGFYEHDLVGLAVQDPSGAVLGEVTGLVLGAVQDLLEVRLTNRRDVLVPFVEAIVTEIDIEAGHVVVDAPAGLFDLDEA
ncbi:16S rRNA-processing protein [Janibacter sp. HTCC2649]|uniref:ribosome maturation factor RimM n=1 Tax=Janibacter sp. HTCC2649 TaxID=313589 RepID=UPI0000670ECB|nr:ribosome maturation factor RimM [Janibacter sp. HTCC2649]EAP97740.1 16S rRNA-processing protein [Janibacter sp. HTCC2649]